MSKDSYLGNEDPTSQNRYTYVGNNPVNYGDPSGHKRFPWFSPVIPKMIEENIINPVIEEQEHQAATEVARIVEEIKEVAEESEGVRSASPKQLIELLVEAARNATPEEKAEIIRKYCEEHNLDDQIAAAMIEELTNKTYDELVVNSYNSNRAAEAVAGIKWGPELGPFHTTAQEEANAGYSTMSFIVATIMTLVSSPAVPTLIVGSILFYGGFNLDVSDEIYEYYIAYPIDIQYAGYVKSRKVVKFLNKATGKVEILREETSIYYAYSTT